MVEAGELEVQGHLCLFIKFLRHLWELYVWKGETRSIFVALVVLGTCFVDQASLEPMETYTPLPPKYLD